MPFDPNTKEIVPVCVLEAVRDVAHRWKTFGLYLDIPLDRLKEIGDDAKNEECMIDTLDAWITGTPHEATVHNLISAVRGSLISNKDLAQRIPAIFDTKSS